MKSVQEFTQHLTTKRKGQKYIEERANFIQRFHNWLGCNPLTVSKMDTFVRQMWSGYVSRDKNTFQFMSDYAEFCGHTADVFNEFVRGLFESEARKAMKVYKDFMVYIPPTTKISPVYLNGLANDEFVDAFLSLQRFLYTVYDAIENGSPTEWGWNDWKDLTWYGIIHNRVIILLNALVECGSLDKNTLLIDKYLFNEHAKKKIDEQLVCKPPQKTKILLDGLSQKGLHIEGFDDENMPFFTVSFPTHPKVITVLWSYFNDRNDKTAIPIRYFSYRFVEDTAVQTHETLFLAMTDGEPEHIREIYYWSYDEAVKHGFVPTGTDKMYCYLYKKGTKEWLLLGKGSSYHESEFLHSINYSIAAKFGFPKTYYTHPDRIEWLKRRFPASFNDHWGGCHKCKEKKGTLEECGHRVIFDQNNPKYRCIKGYFYFKDPTFDDVKEILELYKIENRII
ncbi:MAG: hypothetical protein FWC95_06125 [Defluviitaleaceae bacterium]|nr:hypothetical protein [Defluviitaleaceae bacterium]